MFPSSNRTTTDNTLLTRTQTFSATEWLVNFHQNHGFQSPTGWILQVRYQNRSKSVKNQIPFQLRKQDVASFKLYQVLCIKALHMKARETIHYKRQKKKEKKSGRISQDERTENERKNFY